jgi:hypothetical protein
MVQLLTVEATYSAICKRQYATIARGAERSVISRIGIAPLAQIKELLWF